MNNIKIEEKIEFNEKVKDESIKNISESVEKCFSFYTKVILYFLSSFLVMTMFTALIYRENRNWIYPLLFFIFSLLITAGVTVAGAVAGIKSIISGLKELMEEGFKIYEEINIREGQNSREKNIKMAINMIILPAIRMAAMSRIGGKMVYGIIKKVVEKFETEVLEKLKSEDLKVLEKKENIRVKIVLEYGFKILGNVTDSLILFLQIISAILCSMGVISIISLSLLRVFFKF